MTGSSKVISTVCGCVAILGGSLVGMDSDPYVLAASKANFNKQQCKMVNGRLQAVGTRAAGSFSCVCPPASAVSLTKNKRRLGTQSFGECYAAEAPVRTVNFNLSMPPTTNEPEPPIVSPFTGFNPGNHKNVGKATETPPQGNGSASKFDVNLQSLAANGNCCAGGDKGASNRND
jgi:hypothetical protein